MEKRKFFYSPVLRAKIAFKTFAGAYRYRFNGKENDSETYGVGNALDFGARIYDPRIGRWLSVDPRFSKIPDLSPYNFSENNPLTMIDNGGDSTIYYTARGNKIWVSHDGLENAIVIVDDKQLVRFRRMVGWIKENKTDDANSVNEHLRKMGTVYILNPLESFYSRFHHSNLLKEALYTLQSGEQIKFTHMIVNGKVEPLFGEVKGNLVIEKNGIGVGQKTWPGGLFSSMEADNEKNKIGTIHLHDSPRGQVDLITDKGEFVPYQFGYGPSDRDKESSKNSNCMNVIMDSENIYFHDSKSTAEFSKNERFNKK